MTIRIDRTVTRRKRTTLKVFMIFIGALFGLIYFPWVLIGDPNIAILNMNFHPVYSLEYSFKSEGDEVTLLNYFGNSEELTIPSSINGKPVTKINQGLLSRTTKLKKVTVPFVGERANHTGRTHFGWLFGMDEYHSTNIVPDTISAVTIEDGYIPSNSFFDCKYIATIDTSSELRYLGDKSLDGTKWLENQEGDLVYFQTAIYCYRGSEVLNFSITDIREDTTYIAERAFANQKRLKSIVIPDSVASIGENAFAGSGLRSVSLPIGMTSLPAGAFAFCVEMTSVDIPESITTIGGNAFLNCRKLNEINLNNVQFIGSSAFANCVKLERVAMPEARSIGSKAFSECISLQTIDLAASIAYVGDSVFSDCYQLTDIFLESDVSMPNWHIDWLRKCAANVNILGGVNS